MKTPLHYVKSPDEVVQLVEGGADPNAQDRFGRTPLHVVAMKLSSPDVVSALLEVGADPAIENNRGMTALEYMNSKPSAEEILFKMRDFIAKTATAKGVDMETLFKRDPDLRPETVLLKALDRKGAIERLLMGALGAEGMGPEEM